MNNRKSHNSILFLTTLGVYLGLVLLATANCTLAQSEITINRRPLKDLGVYVQKRIESKSVDLNASFLIELSGMLDKTGKIDTKTAKYTQDEGDKETVEIAKRAVEAVNDSGFFQYLSSLSASNVVIRIAQSESAFTASITSELPSENRARSIVSALNAMVQLARQQKSQEPNDQNDNDDLIFLENMKIYSEGKSFVIRLNLPRAIVQEQIVRKLAEKRSTEPS